nr:helix-turn-helix transcriptional regulator [uncultured Albidiferax sp.]
MSLKETIEKASLIAGSQTQLAKLIGVEPQNISDFKRGTRICGLKKRIQIAEIAGVDRLRTIFEYFEDSLDATDEYEAEAKKTIRAMLDAFPPETDEVPETKKPLQALGSQGVSWRKRRDSNPR